MFQRSSVCLSFALAFLLTTCCACSPLSNVPVTPEPSLKGTQWHYTILNELVPKTFLLQFQNDTLLQRLELVQGEIKSVSSYRYAFDGTTLKIKLQGVDVNAVVDSCEIRFQDRLDLIYAAQIPPVLSKVASPNEFNVSTPLMSVLREGDNLYIATKYSPTLDLIIWFKHCMFNQLMTFYQVGLLTNNSPFPLLNPKSTPEQIINRADSDNIGPLLVSGSSWIGGNHTLFEDGKTKTALSKSYDFLSNGVPIADGLFMLKQLQVKVENLIINPNAPTTTLIKESVLYEIVAGHITTTVSHAFMNEKDLLFRVYYGMQSMASGNEMFVPLAGMDDFIPKTQVEIKKVDAPLCNKFIQRNSNTSWYEAAFLHPDYGIGNHQLLKDNFPIFLQSGAKLYHSMFWDYSIKPQSQHSWRGTYSWFLPVKNDPQILAYIMYMNGKRFLNIEVKKPGNYALKSPLTINSSIDYSSSTPCSINLEDGFLKVQTDTPNSILIVCD